MFPGIQRFKGKELIPSSVPHRRNLNLSWIFLCHPEEKSQNTRNVSVMYLTSNMSDP